MEKSNVPTLELTKENIAKAFGVLGIETPELKKSIETPEIKKSVDADTKEEKENSEKKEAPEKKTLNEDDSEDSKDKDKEDDDDKKKIEKSTESKEEEKEEGKEKEKEDEKEDKKIEKSILPVEITPVKPVEEKKIEKSISGEKVEPVIETKETIKVEPDLEVLGKSFEKSINEKIQALGTINLHLTKQLEKSIELLGQFKQVESSIEEMDTRIKKSLGEANDRLTLVSSEVDGKLEKSLQAKAEKDTSIIKSIQSVEERLRVIENTPNPRKSVTGLGYLQKSVEGDVPGDVSRNPEGNEKVLSLSRDRSAIVDILLEKSMSGTGQAVNKTYENEVMSFESTNRLSKGIMSDLSKNEGIRFVS